MQIIQTADVIEPVDLADVKSYLSLNNGDSSEDALLTRLIAQARGILEEWLPFFISTSTVELSTVIAPQIILKGPVSTVTSVKIPEASGWREIITECSFFGDDSLSIPVDRRGSIRITYLTEGYVPAPIQTALLMMVRSLYLQRDADPMSDAVMSIIRPYLEVNV